MAKLDRDISYLEESFGSSTTNSVNAADREKFIKETTGSFELGTGTYEGDPTTSNRFILDGGDTNKALNKAEQEEQKNNKNSGNNSSGGIRKTPFGKYSNRRRGGVLRYPLELMTQETDYLQIDIQRYVPLQSYRSVPGSDTRYVRGNNFTNRAGRRTAPNLSTKPLINDGTILLPIPSDLKDVNSVKYDSSTLNGLEAAGATAIESGNEALSNAAISLLTGNKEGLNQSGDELKKVGTNLLSEVVQGVGSQEAAKNFLGKRFASQIVGLFGGNVTASQLLARGNGEIINPNMELLFGGPTLRNFRFQFKMTPRNEKEAEQIKLIIRAFKRNMASQAEGGIVGSGNFFLKTPNVFNLRYRTGNRNHPFLNRFKQCFLSDMSVSYTGEGIYSTYEDGTPVSMILDLSFKESQPIYDVDYDERPGTEAVGY